MTRKRREDPRIAALAADIASLEELADVASTKPNLGPAVTARSRIPSLRADLQRLRDLDALRSITDPLERIRAAKVIAEREGSWQAAARYAGVEADLEAKLAEARAVEEAHRLDNLSADELFEFLEDALAGLPAHLRQQVIERLAEPAARPH